MRLLASAASFWLWLLAYVNARELRGLEQGGVFIAGSSYTLRLAFIAPGNSSVRYGGFMDSGHGCPVVSSRRLSQFP